MISKCPKCGSENIAKIIAGANDYFCHDCGEHFSADDIQGEDWFGDDVEPVDEESPFLDMAPKKAQEKADQFRDKKKHPKSEDS